MELKVFCLSVFLLILIPTSRISVEALNCEINLMVFYPVCGSDNVTYSNDHDLLCKNERNRLDGKPDITIAKEGPCNCQCKWPCNGSEGKACLDEYLKTRIE